MIQRSRVSKSGEQTDSLSVFRTLLRYRCSVCFFLGGGWSRYESQDVHLQILLEKKKEKKERELLVNGAEATVSLRLCIVREREREGDHRGHGVTLETSNTLRQIQFLRADTLLIQR